ncbi:MAG: PLP-dependent cysteine synthase family protein [Pseudomonadota bacterium]
MQKIEADFNRSSDTHLHKLELSALEGITLYLKDEAIHPTGSLKHRLARSLILYGLCGGRIGPDTTLIEASSGSTAVSEAYFAQLLGLPFVAVVPKGTSAKKLTEITRYGGKTVEVESSEIYHEAQRLETETGGYYLDQFTNAERATDWRSNNNIAESMLQQMALEPHPVPDWVIVGAGTGGTSATIGRYVRYRSSDYSTTQVCVADPENSVFFDGYKDNDPSRTECVRSRIEGVGRPRMEPSFLRPVIDRMIKVSDAASIATMWWLKDITGRRFGPSTGLNVYAALSLGLEMKAERRSGSLVTLICDNGNRYEDTCHDAVWLRDQGIDIAPHLTQLQTLHAA